MATSRPPAARMAKNSPSPHIALAMRHCRRLIAPDSAARSRMVAGETETVTF